MKLHIVLLAVLLVVPGAGLIGGIAERSGIERMEEQFTHGLSINYDENYARIHLENAAYTHNPGYPMLPMYTRTYTFPLGTEIGNIEVRAKNVETLSLEKKIAPAPSAVATCIGKYEMKEGQVYSRDEMYPSSWYDYHVGVGIENGERKIFLTLYLYPVRYNAVRNEIIHAEDFDIHINYGKGKSSLSTLDTYDLLIITPDDWMADLQPLKEHKESHGIKTIIVGLDEIYSGKYFATQGRDDAEKIKYFIKDAIENWGIKYVMLVGGRQGGVFQERWLMPVRYTNLDDQSNWEAGYLSDLYFADVYKYENGNIVFEDWDSNGNGKFAEWTMFGKDTLDLHPDVYVGRLACRNKMEVKIMVNKIIEYENSNGGNWFKKLVCVGGDSYPAESDPYYEGEEENKVAISYLPDFEATKLWTSLGTLTGPEDVINAVNEGCGFLFFDGHGNPMNWATHPPHDENTWIDGLGVGDMKNLKNDGMYPVCIVGGCHNCQFNVSVFNILRVWEGVRWYQYIRRGETSPESWGWWLIRLQKGGSIATLGYTGLDYFAVGDYDNDTIPDCIQHYSGFMNVNFFKNYANGTGILGQIHAQTINDYIATHEVMKDNIDCKTVEEWVLLGDPTLKIGGYASP